MNVPEHLPGVPAKHEHIIMLVAAIASIVGFVLYLKAQAGGSAAAAGTGYEGVTGGVGDTGTGATGGSGYATSADLAAYAKQTSDAITGLQTDFTHQIGETNDNLTQTQSDFQKAIDALKATVGTAAAPVETIAIDLSAGGSWNSKNDNSWDNETSNSWNDTTANSSTTTHSNSSSGHGGISFGGFSLFGGGGGSGSNSSSNTYYSNDQGTNAAKYSGTSIDDKGTTFSQNIKFAGSGMSDDALYMIVHELAYTSRNAQTASVDPESLVPQTGFGLHPGFNPGYTQPSPYAGDTSIGRDEDWFNSPHTGGNPGNWKFVPTQPLTSPGRTVVGLSS